MKKTTVLALVALASWAPATEEPPLLKGLPVREVSIFKDGHALVEHAGPVEAEGGVARLEGLPAPLLGTFWSWSETPESPLLTARAGSEEGTGPQRDPANMIELLHANEGATVALELYSSAPGEKRTGGDLIEGRVTTMLPVESGQIALRTPNGIRVVNAADVRTIRLPNTAKDQYAPPAQTRFLELNFAKAGKADAHVAYVQQGLRWIPSYRVELNDDKTATVRLQATIVNDLVDMQDATARLVIGVPTFAAAGEIDPIALTTSVRELFRAPHNAGRMALLSNAYMSQTTAIEPEGDGAVAPVQLPDGAKNEDLYVYTIENLTLEKGERIVQQLGEFTVPYESLHVVTIPAGPPSVAFAGTQEPVDPNDRPSARSVARLSNNSAVPFTTAPVMVYKGGQFLCQSSMKYTPVGGSVDLDLNTAVDILIQRRDEETARTQNAHFWSERWYQKIDIAGKVVITNRKASPVQIEIRRAVLGIDPKVEAPGSARMEGAEWDSAHETAARWDVPWWWSRLNGRAAFSWNVEVKPGERIELPHNWSYYWQ